jgi:hypothetical protein
MKEFNRIKELTDIFYAWGKIDFFTCLKFIPLIQKGGETIFDSLPPLWLDCVYQLVISNSWGNEHVISIQISMWRLRNDNPAYTFCFIGKLYNLIRPRKVCFLRY